jgi:uncharacterized protein involved in exopolysaccharide biosynthesis
MKYRLFAFGAAFLLAGCATTCDPSQGGFISGINGLASNCYNQHVDNEQQQLQQLQAAQAAAQQQAAQAHDNVASQQAQLDALRQNVADLDQTLAAELREEIDLQSGQLAQLNAKLQGGSSADYAATEQQYQELKRSIQAETVQLQQDENQ